MKNRIWDKKQALNHLFMAVTAIIKSVGIVLLSVAFKEALDEIVGGAIKPALLGLLFFAAIVLNTLGQYLNGKANARYVKYSLLRLKNDYMRAYFDAPIQLAGAMNPSETISRFTADLQLIDSYYYTTVARMIAGITQAAVSCAVLVYFNGYLALIVAGFAVIVLLLPGKTFKSVEKSGLGLADASERFVFKLNEALCGYGIIKAFGRDKRFKALLGEENETLEHTRYHMGVKYAQLEAVIIFASLLSLCGPFAAGLYFAVNGVITAGTLMAVVNLSGDMIGPIQQLSVDMGKLKTGRAVLKKFRLDMPSRAVSLERKAGLSRFDDKITLENVSFSFGDRELLTNISFEFQKGKKYLITGESGCGKSTLLKLFMGMLDNYAGRIFIDSTDARGINSESLSNVFGIVFQSPFLFNMTVKKNILFFRDYDAIRFDEITRLSGVGRFIENLAQGYDTLMNSENDMVSGGEKQRIALARTLYHGCDILLIDEATSSLDKENSRNFDAGILALNKTVVYVSHKMDPDIAAGFDCVIQLKDGTFVEL